jgi:hypothetical protein
LSPKRVAEDWSIGRIFLTDDHLSTEISTAGLCFESATFDAGAVMSRG